MGSVCRGHEHVPQEGPARPRDHADIERRAGEAPRAQACLSRVGVQACTPKAVADCCRSEPEAAPSDAVSHRLAGGGKNKSGGGDGGAEGSQAGSPQGPGAGGWQQELKTQSPGTWRGEAVVGAGGRRVEDDPRHRARGPGGDPGGQAETGWSCRSEVAGSSGVRCRPQSRGQSPACAPDSAEDSGCPGPQAASGRPVGFVVAESPGSAALCSLPDVVLNGQLSSPQSPHRLSPPRTPSSTRRPQTRWAVGGARGRGRQGTRGARCLAAGTAGSSLALPLQISSN